MTAATQRASRTADDRYVVLPFWLVCDVSASMGPHIGTLNQSLRDFRDSLATNPVLADKVQFGVIDFSDSATEVIPLGDFSSADLERHQLRTRGGTSYGQAFTTVQQIIERDLAAGADRFRYFRPAVFFLTDGQPTDRHWREAFRDLTFFDQASGQGFRSYPLFVPFGIGDADAATLAELVHPQDRSVLFMANTGTTPATVIAKMTQAMLTSMLASGRSALSGAPQHVLPTQDELGPEIRAYPGGDFVT